MPTHPRATRARQRQRLIEACISALHLHGPSKTTVGKVVAIARMSPGIVRFYFESKDAMLVASLEFLAAEFEELLLVPVAAQKHDPVLALERLVELYLGAEIASARKVSVWYSFWGEASSRAEYFEICGTRDSKFETLVHELVGSLIERSRAPQLDADAIALGLIGVLEMLWQGFAFQSESAIDRDAARRRAQAYLCSVFPAAFARPLSAPGAPLPAMAYASAALYDAERQHLFRGAWQFAGAAFELGKAGAFLTQDGPGPRALVLRDAAGVVRAFHNDCRQRPHALVMRRSGRISAPLACPLHALEYDLDGTPHGETPGGPLAPLELADVRGLWFVRAAGARDAPRPQPPETLGGAGLRAPTIRECGVAADWKVVVEQWLERRPTRSWSAERAASIAPLAPARPAAGGFVAPNQWLETGPGGLVVLQVVPEAPGRCRLRALLYPRAAAMPPERALAYLAARLLRARLRDEVAFAESVQRGLESPDYRPEAVATAPALLVAFRQTIARLLPGGARNSGDPA